MKEVKSNHIIEPVTPFDVSAGYWLRVQNKYDMEVTRRKIQTQLDEIVPCDLMDMTLGLEVLRRMADFRPDVSISHTDLLAEFGISQMDLDEIDVEID